MRFGKRLGALLITAFCAAVLLSACKSSHLTINTTPLGFRGTVTAKTANTVTFNGYLFHTDANTVYFVNGGANSGAPGTAADLTVTPPAYASFIAERRSDNSLLITKVQVVNDTSPALEAGGTITALSATSVTINGIAWAINAATTFAKIGGAAGTIADFAVGQQAQVEGPFAAGAFTATDLKADVESFNPGHDGV